MRIWKYIKFALWGYWRIPKGGYCYKMIKMMPPKEGEEMPYLKVRRCPYWDKIEELSEQQDGYCHWMECGDAPVFDDDGNMIEGLGLLWDSVKECGLREYSDKELEKMWRDENEPN